MRTVNLCILLLWTATTAFAQKADSIVVIYDNQHTTIPVPELDKQTTIKMADSVQVIEIAVSRRKLTDLPYSAKYTTKNSSVVKPVNRTKWFSQIEAGYSSSIPFPTYHNFSQINDNFNGYKTGLSVREKERFINNKISIVSGVNLGFIQSFRHVLTPESNDQVILYSEVFRSSFYNISFPVNFNYHFTAFELPAKFHVGVNLVYGYMFISRYNNRTGLQKEYDNGLILLEPNMSIEIGKLGLNVATGRNIFPGMSFYNPIKSINSISLTYRFY